MYKGRRWKTSEARAFEEAFRTYLLIHFPSPEIPSGPLTIHWEFGVNKLFDCTNCLKLAEDVLADYAGFNDNRVYGTTIIKNVVKKGDEFIAFSITNFDRNTLQS